jgi:uncharacterized RmlC-like cupin family protein
MKKFALITMILTAALLVGCMGWTFNGGAVIGSGHAKTETRNVSGFDSVMLATSGDLTVKTGSETRLTIEADDNILDYLTSDVSNGTLELSTKPNSSLVVHTPIRYTLTIAELSGVQLLGSGDIDAEALSGEKVSIESAGSGDLTVATLETGMLEINMMGSGDVKVNAGAATDASIEVVGSGDLFAEGLGIAGAGNDISIHSLGSGRIHLGGLTAKVLNVNMSGSGDVTITAGEADELVLEILGSGTLHAQDVKFGTAQTKLNGSGSTTIWVTGTLNASLLGSGDLLYYGSASVESSELGSGRVRSLGDK